MYVPKFPFETSKGLMLVSQETFALKYIDFGAIPKY
jgi:hypothetical protein